jgi:hypothetical protein
LWNPVKQAKRINGKQIKTAIRRPCVGKPIKLSSIAPIQTPNVMLTVPIKIYYFTEYLGFTGMIYGTPLLSKKLDFQIYFM